MVQVRISEGLLEGEVRENEFGGKIYSFKGIPYAEPPIGDLRFKAPVRKKPWEGIHDAKTFGPSCPQYNIFTKKIQAGNEDCLYLNVYSPNLTPPEPLPVMFWIHGGAFIFGNGDIFGPDLLIRHDVILVTINYRLEVLGFLCLHSEDIPGNAALKDQVEAMRWVQRNIAQFGGDPNQVTIFGESAGGACVSFHLISPMTRGLFKRAITQSGASTNCWALSSLPRERAIVLAKNLGLDSEDDKEIYEFLKSQPVESLVNVKVPLTYFEANKIHLDTQFSIVNERDFGTNERYFYGDVLKTIRAGIHEHVEVINGYMEHEGTVMVANKKVHDKLFKEANSFPEFYVPSSILLKCTIPQLLVIGRKMKKFYFANAKVSIDNIIHLIKFYTMFIFAYGIILWQNTCAYSRKNKIFLYKFSCKSERKMTKTTDALGEITFSSHGDDLAYLFPMKVKDKDIDTSSEGFKMVNNVTKLWTNFAKYGDPTLDDSLGVKWPPYTLEHRSYLNIGEHLVIEENPEEEDMKFWTKIFKEFYPLVDL